MSTFTATTWVPRGFAAAFPTKYVFDDAEYARIAKLAKLQLDDAQEDLDEAQGGVKLEVKVQEGEDSKENKSNGQGIQSNGDIDDDLKEYDLEHYDSDPSTTGDGTSSSMAMFSNAKSLAYHDSNADDPYIVLGDDEASDSEREELQILPTDNLLLAARIEDEVAHLEVYVYEDDQDNLYVHHDIMLPAIPLAVEWFDVGVGNKASASKDGRANFVAVGTMDPDIELWDLDTVDCMYPNAILGAGATPASSSTPTTKKKKKRSKAPNATHHTSSVLALSANRQHRNLLASASADTTVKLWDLATTTCANSYAHHSDKVCALSWNTASPTVLLSGSYDRTVVAADMRPPAARAPRWGLESDVEAVRWDPHAAHCFFVTTEAGRVHYVDARNAPADPALTRPLWSLHAHDQAVSAFDVNAVVPGFFVTGSTDKSVKLWNVSGEGPGLVVRRDLDVGKVFGASFAPDEEVAFRLAVAGSRNKVQVWDTSTNAAVRSAFAGKMRVVEGEVRERLVGVTDGGSDDEDDGEGEGAGEGAERHGWESMEDD